MISLKKLTVLYYAVRVCGKLIPLLPLTLFVEINMNQMISQI